MPVHGEKLILGLSALLQLGKRAFAAEDEPSFGFLVVNETHLMAPYRQAVLWRYRQDKKGEVVTVSGSPEANVRAPYIAWLNRILNHEDLNQHKTPMCITAENVPPQEAEEWEQWLPTHAVWAPLITGMGERLGGLLLVKSIPWTNPEVKLIGKLADSYANAWELILKRSHKPGLLWKHASSNKKWIKIGGIALLFLACWLPVQQSVVAPASVVAYEPAPIRAPLDGVIDHFHVTPNQPVKAGDLLFTLDKADLDNRLNVENKTFALFQEEYRQVLKMAVTDPESRMQKRILEKRLEKQSAQTQGIQILLNRIRVLAPRDGIALFADVNQWLGKPVQIGEPILEIAEPKSTELKIRLPVSDAIVIESGAKVTLYPNMDPLSSWQGSVTQIGYDAQDLEGVLAYVIKARFTPDAQPPRIGLRGTAKIQGQRTTLFYYLFHHPLALMRQRLGL